MLDVRGKLAVVVGGGPVGLRKARSLLSAGAKVRLVASRFARPRPAGATVLRRPYRPADVRGAMLVFACTDDRALNARVAADARRAGALVNAADQPSDCDFFVPATLTAGDVVVAVGTGGAAPRLAKDLKRRLAKALPAGAGRFAAALARLRGEMKAAASDANLRRKVMKRLAGKEGYEAMLRGGTRALRAMMKELSGW